MGCVEAGKLSGVWSFSFFLFSIFLNFCFEIGNSTI